MSKGQPEEAFCAMHCGRNLRTEWQLASGAHSASEAAPWTWNSRPGAPQAYANWIEDHHDDFQGKFGNHRKYESLKPGAQGHARRDDGVTLIGSMITDHTCKWLFKRRGKLKGDKARFRIAIRPNARRASLRQNRSIRLPHDAGQGRPRRHRRRLHLHERGNGTEAWGAGCCSTERSTPTLMPAHWKRGSPRSRSKLGVGMQVMEDAMCNWQKSPNRYLPFRRIAATQTKSTASSGSSNSLWRAPGLYVEAVSLCLARWTDPSREPHDALETRAAELAGQPRGTVGWVAPSRLCLFASFSSWLSQLASIRPLQE